MKKIESYEGHETLIFVNGEENHGKCGVFIEVSRRGDRGEGRSKPNYVLGFGPLPPGRPSCDGNGFAGGTKEITIPHEVLKLF